jgi:hypothetical protein
MKHVAALMATIAFVVGASTADAKVWHTIEGWRVTLTRTGAISAEPCHHKPCGRLWFDIMWHGEKVGHGSVPCPNAPSLHITDATRDTVTVYGCRGYHMFGITLPSTD